MARGMRIITTNTANFAGGSILTVDYSDIINPTNESKTESEPEPGKATQSIRDKFRLNGDEND